MLLSGSSGVAPQGVELRHLRYFVAVADAGTFTHAAKRMFIAQPTLSQQIRRLEEMVSTPLLQRRREGVRLTEAGHVLLEESRTVLSLIEHGGEPDPASSGPGTPAPSLTCLPPPHWGRWAFVALNAPGWASFRRTARPGLGWQRAW